MRKAKQIWRSLFNKNIKALRKLKRALTEDYDAIRLSGMCMTVTYSKNITSKEYYTLLTLIRENKPEEVYSNSYYFKEGELQPRLDWCDNVIDKILNS